MYIRDEEVWKYKKITVKRNKQRKKKNKRTGSAQATIYLNMAIFCSLVGEVLGGGGGGWRVAFDPTYKVNKLEKTVSIF